MYQIVAPVSFPMPTNARVNMMPVIVGLPQSVPENLRGYLPLIEACAFEPGSTAYLTVDESWVAKGQTQRRSGVHTDGVRAGGWGGGGWGKGSTFDGSARFEGLYIASTDGATRLWDCQTWDVDAHGACSAPNMPAVHTPASTLVWLTDRTPHEALPAQADGYRQFFRLVSSNVYGWYVQHSTANPLGVQPTAPILTHNKFAH